MKLRIVISALVLFALSATGTAFAFAEDQSADVAADVSAEATVSSPESILPESVEASDDESVPERIIERKDRWSEGFGVMFNDRLDGTEDVDDTLYFYSSVKDAVADYSDDYYCPTGLNEEMVDIIYDARGVNKEGPVVFQIHYLSDDFDMVWLYPGTGHFGTGADEEVYVSNGNTFYIGEFFDGHEDGYLAWGVIDGNTYQVHTSTAEKAKLIIDSFEKAE